MVVFTVLRIPDFTFSLRSSTPNILDWSCDGSGTGGQGWYDLAIDR